MSDSEREVTHHPETAVTSLLRPRSVALIGASMRPGFAATTLANLAASEFAGDIYPVNPRYKEMNGLTCYPSLESIQGEIDLALVAVAAAVVPDVLRQCAERGVRAAVIFASGFAEVGVEGKALQDEVAEIARNAGIRILGPNCMGLFSQGTGLVASFTGALRGGLLPGSGVAYVGQSGAIGGAVLGMASELGVGVDAWFSTGNEVDLTSAEIIEALAEEPGIRVIATYLENVPDGVVWQRACIKAQQHGTRLVVLRSGRSEEGRKAAASHTGAMVRPDVAYTLVNRACGVVEVGDVDELVGTVEVLIAERSPEGNRIGVITSSGGAGAILADHLSAGGLTLADLAPATKERLAALIPDFGSVDNPVDVTAQLFTQGEDAFQRACEPLLDDSGIDMLIIVLTTIVGERAVTIAQQIADVARSSKKPFGVVWLAAQDATREARRVLREAGVPVTSSVPEQVTRLSHQLISGPGLPGADDTHLIDDLALADLFITPGILTEHAGSPILDGLGVPRPSSLLATTQDEAVAAVIRLGGPCVFKVQSPQIAHKSDIGGVSVGVTVDGAAQAYTEIRAAGEAVNGAVVDGVLVQQMAPQAASSTAVELLLGVQGCQDGYPPVVTVGFGGVTTELYADVASALAPLDTGAAERLLLSLKGAPLLTGFRGRPALALRSAAEVVAAVSRLAVQLGDRLAELEINPLVVDIDGAIALDLLIRSHGRGTEH